MSVDDDLIRTIHQKLNEIQQLHDEKTATFINKKQAAVAMIEFLEESINAIFPGVIRSLMIGSHTNSHVKGYPLVRIVATHVPTHTTLAGWYINVDGEQSPPEISQDEIISEVLTGLRERVRV